MAANSRQNAYLQMFAAVKATSDAHNADWAANDLFSDGYADFSAVLPRTDAALAQKDAQTEGVTSGKKTLRTAVATRTRLLAAALTIYAYASGNEALAGDARTTEDMHTRMAEKSYVGHVKKLRDIALALPTGTLAPYGGVDAAFLTALGTDLDAFSNAIGGPRHVVVERRRGDELLDEAIEDILEIFERQMDPAAVLLGLTTAPDFAAEYKSAREISDPHLQPARPEGDGEERRWRGPAQCGGHHRPGWHPEDYGSGRRFSNPRPRRGLLRHDAEPAGLPDENRILRHRGRASHHAGDRDAGERRQRRLEETGGEKNGKRAGDTARFSLQSFAMFISVTRLRVRSIRFLIPFFLYNERVVKQTVVAAGYLGGSLFVDRKWTFWTLTAWQDKAAMLAYRNADAHRAAMPKLQHWCDEASVAHWEQVGGTPMPAWPEAHHRMMEEGRKSKVRHPSPDHVAGRIDTPRWPNKIIRPLMPKR